jgi:excisionase family DNA binding protein
MYLTYEEAAAYARVTPRQIERWVIETGQLPGLQLPQGTRVSGADLRDFMESRRRQ